MPGRLQALFDRAKHAREQSQHADGNGDFQAKAGIEIKRPYYAPGVDEPGSSRGPDDIAQETQDDHSRLFDSLHLLPIIFHYAAHDKELQTGPSE